MGLFNKKEKKKKKKLSTDQLISRWSLVTLILVLSVGMFFTIKNTVKDIENSTVGNSAVLGYLNEKYTAESLIDKPITSDDKSNVKTKTIDAGIDLFKNSYMTREKYDNVGNANNFSLTANESAFFANEIMAITQNKYSLDYNQINISESNGIITIKYVVSIRFSTFCGITSAEKDVYKELGYTVPNIIYVTSFAMIEGQNTTYQTSFNALNNDKNKEIKSYMNSKNTNDKIEEICHKTFSYLLSDFCNKTNTTFSFASDSVNFATTLGN